MIAGSIWLMILLMGFVTMGSRIAGFFLVKQSEGRLGRALHYLPFGLFGSIVVTGLPQTSDGSWLPLAAAFAATAYTAWRKWPIILTLAAGFAAFAFVSLAAGR